MSNVQEALKAAIEEIENYGKFLSAVGVLIDATKSTKAINQCKAALSEIENCEPVAMVNKNNPHRPYLQELSGVFKLENGTKLYTSQQPCEWVGLSADDISDIHLSIGEEIPLGAISVTEAKLKHLNTKG